ASWRVGGVHPYGRSAAPVVAGRRGRTPADAAERDRRVRCRSAQDAGRAGVARVRATDLLHGKRAVVDGLLDPGCNGGATGGARPTGGVVRWRWRTGDVSGRAGNRGTARHRLARGHLRGRDARADPAITDAP